MAISRYISFILGPVKDSATSRAGERLAPPVTVSELCSNASPDEKHVLGQYSFSTVSLCRDIVNYI